MIIPKISITSLLLALSFYSFANLSPLNHSELRDSMLSLLANNEVESAHLLLEKGLEKAKQEDSLYHYHGLIIKAAKFWCRSTSPEIGIEIYKKGLQKMLWRLPQTDKEWTRLAWLNTQLAVALENKMGDYQQAKIYYENASFLFDKKVKEANPSSVAKYVWCPLGKIYTRTGDYLTAESYLKKYIHQMLLKDDLQRAEYGYNDLALLYENWDKAALAYKSYFNGLELATENNISKSTLLLNLGSFLLGEDSITQSFESIQQAEKLLKKEQQKENYSPRIMLLLGGVQMKLSEAYQITKKHEQAHAALQKAIFYYQEYYGDTKRREFSKIYNQQAGLFNDMKDHKNAIQHYQTSLKNVLLGYAPKDELDLPSAASFYPENSIWEALEGMAQSYQAWYTNNNNTQLLEKALECYRLINIVEAQLRRSYLYENSKLFNLEESQQRSEKAIVLAHQLYQITHNKQYLYQAFTFAERTRSSLLQEALRSSKAINELGLSETALAKEKELAYQVSKAQENWFKLQGEDISDSLLLAANQSLLNAKDAQKRWIDTLETTHPRYYQLKYGDALPSLENYQRMLQGDQLMLEYFVGKEQLYVFAINKNGIQLHNLPMPKNLTKKVLAWRKSIVDYQYPTIDKTLLMASYRELGHELYNDLLLEILQTHKGYSQLLIISSGILDLLPFEALLRRNVASNTNLKAYPYLLNDFTVSYVYSATLYHSLLHLERKGNGLGAFAPNFDSSPNWPALLCSANLFKNIETSWEKDVWLGKDASSQRFREIAGNYQLLHLATHAQANAEFGDFSFILFHNQTGGFDSLFAKDLYLMDINAELVILSACETAMGTLYNSEGVISMARAFHYAGARSVLTTLWRINEGANCHLMEYFYDELAGNPSKSLALQSAKKRYIKHADQRYAHPVYWAGFQFSGNPRPVDAPSDWVWYLLGGFLVVFFVFLFKNKEHKSALIQRQKTPVLS